MQAYFGPVVHDPVIARLAVVAFNQVPPEIRSLRFWLVQMADPSTMDGFGSHVRLFSVRVLIQLHFRRALVASVTLSFHGRKPV